ncbi:PREDICTED: asparagine synthetase domain-containing protein CG17486 [Nicrophorus vespilloides]|uniref:Asparagine synthetase [glutamine-hydrolyzing] n=1 Tax=Nicrophorus vespilloides TaxID=110193 RepID=A0ABM1NIC0_NICVS|nr:PREDICTED: asparagine synthetase domain-containing protein CG17486 [Nicrophorus vespilloides]
MCGIICLIQREHNQDFNKIFEGCEYLIKNRGPDSYQTLEYICSKTSCNLKLGASVLWLQGKSLTKQPLENESSIFVYNGDVFGSETIQDNLRESNGDTELFQKALDGNDGNIKKFLKGIRGPFAFIYLNKQKSKLYFARDIYGRRSLLLGCSDGGDILLSSCVTKNSCNFIELPAIGIFSYDLQSNQLELVPWDIRNNNFSMKIQEVKRCLGEIDLIVKDENVKTLQLDFTEPNLGILKNLSKEEIFETLLKDEIWGGNVKKLSDLLHFSVLRRIKNQPKYCKKCFLNLGSCKDCRVGVLFSGGLDCTILALIVDEYLDESSPIDLLNVAFENPGGFDTPDRLTGRESWMELKELRPERVWNFVEINVDLEELNEARDSHVKHLIYPLNTVLDDSLGCALWFASKGMGDGYISTSRVLIVGMGADELFGGYTRHRAALNKGGWQRLTEVLQEDWQNISHRNLARDDRVVSDHGRQLRTPYLDEDLVEFVLGLPAWQKTYPSDCLPQGIGEKILLRSLAYRMGLRRATNYKKRALQFGSRIANKKENAHEISPRL